MLYLVLTYLIISFVCFFAGLVFYALVNKRPGFDESRARPIISYLVTGLVLLTGLGQWIVLIQPLNLLSSLVVLLLLILFSIVFRKAVLIELKKVPSLFNRHNAFFFICFCSFLLMILVLNSGPTLMDDTESYHIQMVKWMQEYGTVPGIANLHLRFGFNSSWFVSIALLSPKMEGINHYLLLNGLLSLWFCHYLLEKIYSCIPEKKSTNQKNGFLPFVAVLFACFIIWPMIRGNATNANYDFISTGCIIILFIEAASNFSGPDIEWLIWPCFLFTVRIMNYPLLLLGFFYFMSIFRRNRSKAFIISSASAFLLIGPFLARNVMLSGYPFFPVYQLDCFSFDWKADKQKIVEILEYIKYYNRVNPVRQSLASTRALHFPEWIISWYRYLLLSDKFIVLISFSSYLMLFLFWRRTRLHFSQNHKILIGVMTLQLVSWLFIAPDPRFAYGPLLLGVFSLLWMLPKFGTLVTPKNGNLFLVCLSAITLFYAVQKMATQNQYRNWGTPQRLPVPAMEKIMIDGIELHIPEKILNNWNPRCYDIALPCLYQVDPRLRARGKTVKEGFKLTGLDSGERWEGEYKIKK
jgi:hypothetical protein